jgi:predicted outer membrane repeat protein
VDLHTAKQVNLVSLQTENRAERGAAMHVSFGVDLEVFDGVEISGNIADQSGGGMYIYNSIARLHHDVTLTGNEAKGAGPTSDGGGAIMLKFDCALELRDGVTIRKNSATYSGGGIGAQGPMLEGSNPLVLDIRGNVSISNNVALGGGGGIEISNANISISDHVAISNNQAGESGGAIAVTHSNIDIRNQVVIQENDCQDQGGAVFATFSTIRLASDVAVIENSAQSDGGGICILVSVTPHPVFSSENMVYHYPFC